MTNIAPLLKMLIKRFGLENRMTECLLNEKWETIVGKSVASHTQPCRISFRKLYLHVDNSIWLHQLSFFKDEIITKVNSFAGNNIISKIHLKIGMIEERIPPTTNKKKEESLSPAPKELTHKELATIEEILRPIKDHKIKDGMRRVLIRDFSSPSIQI